MSLFKSKRALNKDTANKLLVPEDVKISKDLLYGYVKNLNDLLDGDKDSIGTVTKVETISKPLEKTIEINTPEPQKESYSKDYDDAVRKDRETYISLFGTPEEKALLKKETDELKRKEDEKLLREAEALKLAEEIRIKENSIEVQKQKIEIKAEFNNLLNVVRKDILIMKENLVNISSVGAIYWEYLPIKSEDTESDDYLIIIGDLKLTIKDVEQKIEDITQLISTFNLEELKNYPMDIHIEDMKKFYTKSLSCSNDLVALAKKVAGRQYDLKTTALIDASLIKSLNDIFNALNTESIDLISNLETVIESTYTGIYGTKLNYKLSIENDKFVPGLYPYSAIVFEFEYEELTDFGCTINIRTHNQKFNYVDYRHKRISPEFETFYVEVFSREWFVMGGIYDDFQEYLQTINIELTLHEI